MSDAKYAMKDELCRQDSLNKGLLMIPTAVPNNLRKLRVCSLNHKRTGSTGTTGDESYTTDEDDADLDETDFDITGQRRTSYYTDDYSSLSGISTIMDKIDHASRMHRNCSDVSVYSGLTDKCSNESVNLNESNSTEDNDDDSDCKCDAIDWGMPSALENVDRLSFAQLKKCLREAHRQLKLRKEEVLKLSRIKKDVEVELEDLTASLFQEAHNMVREANEKQAAAERALKESEMKVDVLLAEVAALKTLVITSTPSSPNPHMHPQIDKNKDEGVVIFSKKNHRSPSHSHYKYGKKDLPSSRENSTSSESEGPDIDIELDPIFYEEFLQWKQEPVFDKKNFFIRRVYEEDINLCLSFFNTELSEKVIDAVEKGIILIEAFGERSKSSSKCALMNKSKECSYRMNIGDGSDNWYNISQICRNRITAVCDFLNYLKYIERGLVKCSAQDMYCEVMRLRKNMALGRLGFQTSS